MSTKISTTIILVIGLLAFITTLFWRPVDAQAPELTQEEVYHKQLEDWIERLAKKEGCGKGIIDTNGRWSRGDLCFQDGTFKSYSKKYSIYEQKLLAMAMIKDDYSNWTHWRCSVITDYERCPKWTWGKHIGKPPKYDTIKLNS